MLRIAVDIQRDICLALAEHIKALAAGGGWAALLTFLPLGIVFGVAGRARGGCLVRSGHDVRRDGNAFTHGTDGGRFSPTGDPPYS